MPNREHRLDRSGQNLDAEEQAALRYKEQMRKLSETQSPKPDCIEGQYLLFQTGERRRRKAA